MRLEDKSYIIILQCDIVKQKCSGYYCEKSFNERDGGFSGYPKDKQIRTIYMTCGGCCGRATHRKISHLTRMIKAKEDIGKDQVVVQLSSCITRDNYHAPKCPHLDYITDLLNKLEIDYAEDTRISKKSEEKRQSGEYCL